MRGLNSLLILTVGINIGLLLSTFLTTKPPPPPPITTTELPSSKPPPIPIPITKHLSAEPQPQTICSHYTPFPWPRMRFDSKTGEDDFDSIVTSNIKMEWFKAEFGYRRPTTESRASYTSGCVVIHHNVRFTCTEKCGWDSPLPVSNTNTPSLGAVCPIIINAGNIWQHFTDGVLPKLIQALPLILKYNATVLLQTPKDPIIPFILKKIGVPFKPCRPGKAKIFIDPCKTPYLNPSLWLKMKRAIVPQDASSPFLYDIVLFIRFNTREGGRRILNQKPLEDAISAVTPQFMSVDPATKSPNELITIMQHTRTIIGVHGGAMFNLLFARQSTFVIELVPYNLKTKSNFLKHPGGMVYIFAALLGNPYLRIMVESNSSDINVPIPRVINAIRSISPVYQSEHAPLY